MAIHRPSKWTAFLLSLAVPGAGQLLARSPTALLWFAVVAGLTVLLAAWLPATLADQAVLLKIVMLAPISLASAWHARGLLEGSAPWPGTKTARSKSRCGLSHGRNISAQIRIDSSLSPAEIWRRISDLPNILTIDPFHERITMMRDSPQAGVDVVLHHNAMGRRFDRFGRILWWREGEGYALSDLSARDRRGGFPHVFVYRIEPPAANGESAALIVDIKGRWTSSLMPLWIGRWWIAAVCRYHASLLRRVF